MPRSSEEISNYNSGSSGRTDANLANDSNHLGGIPADEYATQEYVQRYHNTKEAAQKEYIDEKNSTGLNSAKAYTDLMINNQDFSGFAQKTDVLALQQDTANKLAQCQTTCANNLENTRQQIVNDVNAGFDDVGQSISQLNANQQQLFTSVSNGKAKVAAAITGKGVTTASDATYETMASNIRNIESGSGGGEVDPNYMNTSDATVNEGDIALGKTAYARGNKLYGTHVCEDSSDANAAASDILLGKSAYVNGEKIYGTLIAEAAEGQPTYGLDTSDATALASDVANGKTFYARGQKLIGTAYGGEVEEIYGTKYDELIYEQLTGLGETDPVTGETVTSRRFLKFSKNLDYCVCCSVINNETFVESYAVNDQGIYIQGSVGLSGETTYKKYRYSYTDLGLGENEVITDLEFTKPGIFGSNNTCILVISTIDWEETGYNQSNDTHTYKWEYKIHLYNYNLLENGVIGKMHTSQSNVPEPYTEILFETNFTSTPSWNESVTTMKVASFNLRDDKLFVIINRDMYASYKLYDLTVLNTVNGLFLIKNSYDSSISLNYGSYALSCGLNVELTKDDRFAYVPSSRTSTCVLIYNDYTDSTTYTPILGTCQGYIRTHIPGTNKFFGGYNGGLYEVYFDEMGRPRTTDKSLTLAGGNASYAAIVTSNNKLLNLGQKNDQSQLALRAYNIQDILNAETGTTVAYTDETPLTSTASDEDRNLNVATNNSAKIFFYTKVNSNTDKRYKLNRVQLEEDLTNIIGLQYRGNYYYRQDPHILTAGQPDVRAGKTFIGWMGTQETGTMEVE